MYWAECVSAAIGNVMTNLEAVHAVLTRHIDARQWTTDAVARDVVAKLGLDPMGGVGAMSAAAKAKADEDAENRNALTRVIAAAHAVAEKDKKAAMDEWKAELAADLSDDMAVDKARILAQAQTGVPRAQALAGARKVATDRYIAETSDDMDAIQARTAKAKGKPK